ncbi:hypothetical protein [Halobacillus sp. KGW1]|uniref:hypothetical protein n=1 Tax=Halobacillus sp. KGW1 TaxID=1793726 RepID=UPI000AEAFC76|nr:hypothetical protein [Halobacillus sp. KGW1]
MDGLLGPGLFLTNLVVTRDLLVLFKNFVTDRHVPEASFPRFAVTFIVALAIGYSLLK